MPEKKKKKKAPGGANGAPPRSEPRVQIFTKFAGCNFQLATRDFGENLFDTDQDAQTDLMPMLMAIQNNAAVVPMGGIETRQNIVKLFDAPTGKHFTGVATLIADRLYAAAVDRTILHGVLGSGSFTEMNVSNGGIVDNNDTFSLETQYSHSGTVS